MFWHLSSSPSSDLHESGTIWTGKSFSIDLNDQNQVPIGPYEGFYQFFEFFEKNLQKIYFFFIVRGWFLDPSEGFRTSFGLIRMKKWWFFFVPKNHFFWSRKQYLKFFFEKNRKKLAPEAKTGTFEKPARQPDSRHRAYRTLFRTVLNCSELF